MTAPKPRRGRPPKPSADRSIKPRTVRLANQALAEADRAEFDSLAATWAECVPRLRLALEVLRLG